MGMEGGGGKVRDGEWKVEGWRARGGGRRGHRALHAPLSVLFWGEVLELLALPLVLLQILMWGLGRIIKSSLARL